MKIMSMSDESETIIGRRTSTDTLSVVALPQETVDTTNRESETSLGRATMKSLAVVHQRPKSEIGNAIPTLDRSRLSSNIADPTGIRRSKEAKKAEKRKELSLTTESSCCRWTFRRICRQSF